MGVFFLSLKTLKTRRLGDTLLILNSEFLILNSQFLILNSQFLIVISAKTKYDTKDIRFYVLKCLLLRF
jgi:hypothetical protein